LIVKALKSQLDEGAEGQERPEGRKGIAPEEAHPGEEREVRKKQQIDDNPSTKLRLRRGDPLPDQRRRKKEGEDARRISPIGISPGGDGVSKSGLGGQLAEALPIDGQSAVKKQPRTVCIAQMIAVTPQQITALRARVAQDDESRHGEGKRKNERQSKIVGAFTRPKHHARPAR
jgi:hypothetical protein